MEGWIKIHRKLSMNTLWLCEPFTRGQAWVDLLMLANHEDSFFYVRNVKVDIKRGEVGWSEPKLADRWKWSRTKVRKFLNDLEKEQQIVQHKNFITQIVMIVNYKDYQKKEQQQEQQKDSRKTAERQQQDVNKNDKNDKNEKKDIKSIFEIFRKAYKGTKKGLDVEYDNFIKKNDSDIVNLLLPSLEKEIEYRSKARDANAFVAEWKNLSTWINQKCWEQEFGEITPRVNGHRIEPIRKNDPTEKILN